MTFDFQPHNHYESNLLLPTTLILNLCLGSWGNCILPHFRVTAQTLSSCGCYSNLHRVMNVLSCGLGVFILGCPGLTFGWRFGGVSIVESSFTAAGSQQLRPGSNG